MKFQPSSLIALPALGLAGMFFLLPMTPLPAVLVMEADFSVGKDLTVGSPATGTLTGDAVVADGSLQINTSGTSGVNYGVVTNYLNVSSTSWGSNTLVTTFSLNSAANVRRTLMGTSGDNQNGLILWANSDHSLVGPRLGFSTAWTGASASLEAKPLANTDYFLGASWLDNEDGTISVQMYLRALDDLEGLNTVYQTFNLTNPSGLNGMSGSTTQTLGLGHRLSNGDALNGDMYLFQAYNTFTSTQGDFNTLFNSVVVPEPQTALLLLGALVVALAQRATSRQRILYAAKRLYAGAGGGCA